MKLNKTTKQIFSLYTGTITSLLVGIGVSVLTTRILGSEGYGDYKFFQTIFNFIFVISSFGLFNSISRLLAHENSIDKQQQLYGIYVLIVLFLGLSGGLFLFLFSYFQGSIFENDLNLVFRYLGILIAFLILNQSLTSILQGNNKIGLLSLLKVLPPLSFLIILWILKKLELNQIILLYYISIGFYSLVLVMMLKPKFNNLKHVLNRVIKENNEFGRKIYSGSLANVATGYLGGILIGYYLDNELVGFFTLSITISSPLLLIPSVVGTTLFKKFATAKKINQGTITLTGIISFLSFVAFYVLIEPLIKYIYPKEFVEVINYSRIIAIGSILHGFGDLYNRFLYAKGKGKLIRNGAIVVGFINLIGYLFLIKYFGINGALITRLLSSATYLLAMLYCYLIVQKNT